MGLIVPPPTADKTSWALGFFSLKSSMGLALDYGLNSELESGRPKYAS